MKAVMLAAGLGTRLGNSATQRAPKLLLEFAGKSLLERHIDILTRNEIEELVIGVGFNREQIEQEIVSLGAQGFVRTVFNPAFEAGSVVTLWTLREELCGGGPVLLMDGDVLYDDRLMDRLAGSAHNNCVLLDRVDALDDEAVKLCIRAGEVIEFRKWVSAESDIRGESVGFFKLSNRVAKSLLAQTRLYIEQDRRSDPYEEPLRDVLLTSRPGVIAYEDITGLPWIEIDSRLDVERANREILPRLLTPPIGLGVVTRSGEARQTPEYG